MIRVLIQDGNLFRASDAAEETQRSNECSSLILNAFLKMALDWINGSVHFLLSRQKADNYLPPVVLLKLKFRDNAETIIHSTL